MQHVEEEIKCFNMYNFPPDKNDWYVCNICNKEDKDMAVPKECLTNRLRHNKHCSLCECRTYCSYCFYQRFDIISTVYACKLHTVCQWADIQELIVVKKLLTPRQLKSARKT